MAQPPEITAEGAQPYAGSDSPPLNLHKASDDLERGAQTVVTPHLQPVSLQHTSNILGGDEPFVGPNSQPINLQDTGNIQEGGAQPFVSVTLQASNLTKNIFQGGGDQPTNLQDSSTIQGGSDAPLMTTAASATQAPQVIRRDRNYYRPLYLAAQRGDWETVKSFIDSDPNALTDRITNRSETVLIVAADNCQWEFVLKLLELLSPHSIAMQDSYGNTALHIVAFAGSLRTAKALVEKNANLLHMINNGGLLPLHYSILSRVKELVWYLSLKISVPNSSLSETLSYLNAAGFFDVSLYFIRKYPELALNEEAALLFWLASKPSSFFSGCSLRGFGRWIYKFVSVNMEEIPGSIESSPTLQSRSFASQAFELLKRLLWKAIAQLVPSTKVVQDMKLKHKCAVELVNLVCGQLSSMSAQQIIHFLENPNPIMSTAVANGIEEIVSTFLQYFPELLGHQVMPQKNILHAAIEYRQDKIFNILKKISSMATNNLCAEVGELGNTTLHLVGKLAPLPKLLSIPGPALQMQRELQWFKAVEKITLPWQRELRNRKGQTAKEVFWSEHRELVVEAEKWLKDTVNYCMVVSTLIAGVLFAAAFTVSGGNINDKGTPFFPRMDKYMISFVFFDAIGLFSSLTSLLIYLDIVTARYLVDDFLQVLPKKLIIGLNFLFIAILAMIVAFIAPVAVMLRERWSIVSVPITLLAYLPMALLVVVQLPKLIRMFLSTHRSSIFP